MREIKFRGYNGAKWLYSTEISGIPCFEEVHYFMPNKDNELTQEYIGNWDSVSYVGQYTGLKDKNDVEIYEGDILGYKKIIYTNCSEAEIEKIEDEVLIGLITYRPLASIIKPYSKKVRMFGYDSENKEGILLDLKSKELEVIGNIYENKNLLKSNLE